MYRQIKFCIVILIIAYAFSSQEITTKSFLQKSKIQATTGINTQAKTAVNLSNNSHEHSRSHTKSELQKKNGDWQNDEFFVKFYADRYRKLEKNDYCDQTHPSRSHRGEGRHSGSGHRRGSYRNPCKTNSRRRCEYDRNPYEEENILGSDREEQIQDNKGGQIEENKDDNASSSNVEGEKDLEQNDKNEISTVDSSKDQGNASLVSDDKSINESTSKDQVKTTDSVGDQSVCESGNKKEETKPQAEVVEGLTQEGAKTKTETFKQENVDNNKPGEKSSSRTYSCNKCENLNKNSESSSSSSSSNDSSNPLNNYSKSSSFDSSKPKTCDSNTSLTNTKIKPQN